MFRSVESLLRPKSIAIVGASDSGGGGRAKQLHESLVASGCPVPVYLVNPNRTELWGQKVYPTIASIPDPVDLALIIIPAPAIPEAVAEAAAHGVKCALLYAARFGEDGDGAGLARAQAIKTLCDTQGFRVSGPNCMGSLSIREKLPFYSLPRVRRLLPGSLGVVFQSGGTLQFWLEQAGIRGLGISYAISSGNELDLDLADYINFMVEDDHTKVIACMVEGVRRPEAFMAVAEKALAAKKPILVVKTGRSEAGREAAKSHTGALAGDDAVFDAVCAKYGIVRCASLDELVENCLAFKGGRFPHGPRVAMVGYSGGLKGIFLDDATEEGVVMATLGPKTQASLTKHIFEGLAPINPVDAGADAATQPRKFSEICQIVCRDPGVDLVAMQGHLPTLPNEPLDAAMYAAVQASTEKPVIVFNRMAQNVSEDARRFQDEAGVPFLQGVPEMLRAVKNLIRYGATLRRGVLSLPVPAGRAEDLVQPAFDRLLAIYDIALPRGALVKTVQEAAERAASIGFPVAVKIVSPQASHKTEIDGVALNLRDGAAVRQAAEAMVSRLAKIDPQATVDGFLVQEMVAGVELIVGIREDPQFGPFMVVGLGGIFVEVLKDLAIRLLPVDEDMAREMLRSLRGRAILDGFRGEKPRDVEAAIRAIAGLSRLFLDQRAFLSDLEINPLIVLGEGHGVRAVDLRPVRRAG